VQELATHVFIETAYAGVTLGAISWPHGLVMIDAPLRPDDIRAWRSGLLNLGGGVERMLINLDAHYDRTLGSRAMDCTVLGHEKMTTVFRSRPLTMKATSVETGAVWEQHGNLGPARWAAPELTFSERMEIHWDGHPLVVEYRPGSSAGACWATLPHERIVFVGDAVVIEQPPFLAGSDLPVWKASLESLLSHTYAGYQVVSGRGGLAKREHIQSTLRLLEEVEQKLAKLADHRATTEEAERLAEGLLKSIHHDASLKEFYRQRLAFGLKQYYLRTHRTGGSEAAVE
jgi:glyoxylase-like metal-dependent hydrolase (beta-lactamase superfamily II)